MDYVDRTMKSLPESDRPYEKCWEYGPRMLTDAELLAVILKTGSRGESVLNLTRRLLSMPEHAGLSGLYHVTPEELRRVRGIGKVKAIQILCVTELCRRMARANHKDRLVMTDPSTIAERYMEDLCHEETEKVMVLSFDSAGGLLGEEVISQGTVNMALISPREIFLCALRFRAVGIVMLHNHPSGDPQPSMEDTQLTRRVASCGRLLGIKLLDHIIIGDHRAVSMAEADILD